MHQDNLSSEFPPAIGRSARLANKNILVLGAGCPDQGIGNGMAVAATYAWHGANVLGVDRDASALANTNDLIRKTKGDGEFHTFVAELTESDAAKRCADHCESLWGGVDVVHFNVGMSRPGGVVQTSPQDWQQVIDLNLTAALNVARETIPLMQKSGGGAFVFISSIAALGNGPYSYTSYEVAKAGLNRLSTSIAGEYASSGIRSNVISLGVIDTPHVSRYVSDLDRDKLASERAAIVPMGRQGSPWDAANASLFLASDEAGFISGANLVVDGAMSCSFA